MHAKEHEAVLQQIVTGELDAAEGRAAELLAECATCRSRLEELRALAQNLSATFRVERDALAEAAGLTDAPGEAAVAAAVRARGKRRVARRTFWIAAVAAAAAAVLAVVGDRLLRGSRSGVEELPHDLILDGGGTLTVERPIGTVDSYLPFRWTSDAQPGWYYYVEVRDDTDERRDELLAEAERWRTNEWSPSPERGTWPDRIVWSITVYDSTGNDVGSLVVRARLASD